MKQLRTGTEVRGKPDSGLKLSKYFIEKWKEERSEPVPSIRQVDLWLMEAYYVQKFREVLTAGGNSETILAAYWLPDINLILKIDEKSKTVVTFLTPRR